MTDRRDGRPVVVGDRHLELQQIKVDGSSPDSISERWLQELIFRHPACLPITEIEPGFDSLMPVCMELPTANGFVDVLLMTGAGEIVIVETKLWRNPQARREVLAQAMDYAGCLFGMVYEELEAAVLMSEFAGGEKPASLYSLFDTSDGHSERDFVDAVNRNLRRGRIVVLVVGDGIRSETERLWDSLQAHAGFHFTFALVELSLYRLPDRDDLLVMPRTLARTVMIERGVVRIPDESASVTIETLPDRGNPALPGSITVEEYFDALAGLDPALPDKMRDFIGKMQDLGVQPDFRKSLNLRWERPDGTLVNLGYIQKTGSVWTDTIRSRTPHHLADVYLEELAEALGGYVEREMMAPSYHVRIGGKAPRIDDVAHRLGAWAEVASRFIACLREHYSTHDE